MSDSPEQIRANIERIRNKLSGDVDALADKVSPARILERQTNRITDSLGSARDRVMGVASNATHSASGTLRDASNAAARKTRGNPLAKGIIAFGMGVLAASLIPASTKEKDLTSNLRDAAKPLVADLADSTKDAADKTEEPAGDAASWVKDVVTDAAATAKDDATPAAAHVSDETNTPHHGQNFR